MLLLEQGHKADTLLHAVHSLSARTRIIVVRSPRVTDTNWGTLGSEFQALLQGLEIRQVSLIGAAATTALVQNLALLQPKLVRTLVLVDPVVRPHPGVLSKFCDWLEMHMPLGLPLRVASPAFDVRPYLQRLRCPVLVVLNGSDSNSSGSFIAHRLPTGWVLSLAHGEFESKFSDILLQFQDVPARCPQKNRDMLAAV